MLVSLDLSLTSIGWARDDGSGSAPEVGLIEPRGRGVVRLQAALNEIVPLVASARLVLIEGYAFGRPEKAHQLGELGGVVRLALHQMGKTWIEIPPSCVKKLATGDGGASKDEVLVEAVRRLGYVGFSKDEADALWLLQAARIHYGLFGAPDLPKKHLGSLSKVEWPRLTLEAAS